MAMTVERFLEILDDKGLTISSCRNGNTNSRDIEINPLHLDEINRYASNNGFETAYHVDDIRLHTMEVMVSIPTQKVLTDEQKEKWLRYLEQRDKDNGEQYSWFNITTNKYDHKDGLEMILGVQLFSMEVEEYQDYIA